MYIIYAISEPNIDWMHELKMMIIMLTLKTLRDHEIVSKSKRKDKIVISSFNKDVFLWFIYKYAY